MLVEERQMKEFDSVLISDPLSGVGFQTAAALNRLGKKVLGFINENENAEHLKFVKVLSVTPHWKGLEESQPFSSFLACPSGPLSQNRQLTPEEVSVLKNDLAKAAHFQTDAQLIVVLPHHCEESILKELTEASHQRATFLLTPTFFGLRDHNILDQSIEAFLENPKFKPSPLDAEARDLVFLGDLVGIIVSLLLTRSPEQFAGKHVEVPASKHSSTEFFEAFKMKFEEAFKKNPSLKLKPQKWSEKLLQNLLSKSPEALNKIIWKPTTRSHTPPETPRLRALDHFPTRMTQLSRALEQAADHYCRHPEMKSHYFPSRAI